MTSTTSEQRLELVAGAFALAGIDIRAFLEELKAEIRAEVATVSNDMLREGSRAVASAQESADHAKKSAESAHGDAVRARSSAEAAAGSAHQAERANKGSRW